jgi:hypothetical protein
VPAIRNPSENNRKSRVDKCFIPATPDDETVVAGSGVPGLFGEAVNELMCPAS